LFYEQSILSPYDDGKTFGREVAEQLFPGQNPAEAARSIARLLPEGRFRLAGTANSAGVNLGYLYRHPGTHTSIGLSYRSGTAHHLKGKASFAFTDDSAIAPFLPESQTIEDLFPTQDAAGLFQTPATYNIGIANTALPGTTLAMDVTFQDYHRFRALPINFTQTSGTATPPERKIEFDFRNSVVVMAGIEKRMGEDMAVRAGFVFDHTPVPDKSTGPLFPDSSRFSLTLGASKRKGNTEFSVFYQAMNMVARTTNVTENNNQFTNGLYDNFAHLAGVGLRMYIGN
jgi:long-chain fatty acid transport protein